MRLRILGAPSAAAAAAVHVDCGQDVAIVVAAENDDDARTQSSQIVFRRS
jgi:hypothetical protein